MPIQVNWTAIPNGVENGKLKIALMATIKLTSANQAQTTLGASFPAILNWHKNKFSFVLTFAGAMGIKTVNVGPLSVPSQTAWPSTFKTDTPVKPYLYEQKMIKAWESYSVTRLLERTQTSYASVTTGALSPKYAGLEGLIIDEFKAADIYRSPFWQPRQEIPGGTIRPGIGTIPGGGVRPPDDNTEGFDEHLWACSDFGTAVVGPVKEMLAMAYSAACDDFRNNGGELPEDSALWWEARSFFEAYDRHEENEQTPITQVRPGTQIRPGAQIRPGIANELRPEIVGQRPKYVDRYGGRPMAVQKPNLDFHEALAILGEHPALMRQFGIIFDVEIPVATVGLAPSGSVTVSATWTTEGGGSGASAENPLTVFQYSSAQNIFLPGHKAGAEYRQGFYNLGSDFCQITGVDVDSLAMKVLDFAGTIRTKYALYSRTSVIDRIATIPPAGGVVTPGAPTSQPPATTTARPPVATTSVNRPISTVRDTTIGAITQARPDRQMVLSEALWQKMGDRPDTAAPPGLRSAGVSIARKDRSIKLAATMAAADANMAKMTAPKSVTLYFEDMVRGYRMDVFANGKWHSLTTRKGNYTLPGNLPVPNVDEESWVSAAASSDPSDRADAAADRSKIHEVMVRWQGFSQVCQRPGSTLDQQGNLIEGNTQLDPRFPIRMQFTPRPGTLPILRFGRQYRFRVRLATVAGTGPEMDAPSPGTPYETPPLTYRRWESVPSPAVYEHAQTKEGESANHIVIRKFVANPSQIDPALRQLVPPDGEVSLAETHGMFDKDGKPDPAKYALIQERENMQPLNKYVGGKITRLPYFADPMALGVTIQGAPHIATPLSLNYPGTWPEQQSLTLELRANAAPSSAAGDRFTLNLIPGEIAFPKLSSNTKPEHNELFGIMEWVPVANRVTVAAAVHQGRVWTITPFRESTVVFACQIPEQEAKPDRPYATRGPGSTRGTFGGRVQTHSWTTSSVDFDAYWTDDVDMLEEARRTTLKQDKKANAFKLKIVRGPTAPVVFQSFTEDHEFGDTKHHEVRFNLVAHSPFKQYFPASWPLPSDPVKTRFTETNEDAFTVHVPSSRRPAPPQIEYVVPTFGWSRNVARDGKSLTSSRDGNGLRVYLRRPWFSTGNGEKLAVVLLKPSVLPVPDKISKHTTVLGADPVFRHGDVPSAVSTANFTGGEAAVANLGVPDIQDCTATVVPYPVYFDADRQMWYADITINAGSAYTPFVRLALARYQQYSLTGLHLSNIAVADIMQIQNDRTVSVSFGDQGNRVIAAVIGTIGETQVGQNRVYGTIEEKVGADDETGWRTVMVDGKELTRIVPVSPPGINPNILIDPSRIARPPGTLVRPGTVVRPPGGNVRPPEEDFAAEEVDLDADAQGGTRPTVIQQPQVRPGTVNPQLRPGIRDITVAPKPGAGEFILPKARTAATYRLVIREYELFESDTGEPELPEVPAAASTEDRDIMMVRVKPGARLVYMDVIPLS